MEITSPEKFATWFNGKYQGAYRKISAEDVRDLTTCGLIGRYRYYSLSRDGETVRGILQYGQMREGRPTQEVHDEAEPPKCKMCGRSLPVEPEDKSGRPKEYCAGCELFRDKERKKKSRRLRRK